jgi:uncharacterized membrane protein YdjX (TVP38/TMEM64 family)
MRRPLRLLLGLTLLAVAVPLVPFLLVGTRLDHAVAAWLDPPPSPPMLAAAEVAILAVDVFLPVPSSVVATLGGARLGVVTGTLMAWLGMTLGAFAGWGLGRVAGGRIVARLDAEARQSLAEREARLGPLLIVLTRPLPLLAEAAAILAGASGMPARTFATGAAVGNLAIAFAWSLIGRLGAQADALQWVVIWSLVLPVAVVWAWMRTRLQSPSRGV